MKRLVKVEMKKKNTRKDMKYIKINKRQGWKRDISKDCEHTEGGYGDFFLHGKKTIVLTFAY